MLTEAQVQNSFRKIVSSRVLSAEDFERADELLDKLRPESPLRFRLMEELEELRKQHSITA